MKKLAALPILILSLLTFGCASSRLETAAITGGVVIGMEQDQVLQVMGEPQKTGRVGDYEFLNYCILGSADEMYEFVFQDDYLVHFDRYTNFKDGPCEKFFRPISIATVERSIAQGPFANQRRETYNIDLLKITTLVLEKDPRCASGSVNRIILEGAISPDSSFAVSRLLDRLTPCADASGRRVVRTTISLKSGGGLLEDGYLMGRIFRERDVTTVVENGDACASSCAVAFLGGTKRIVEEEGIIMYHAPYFTGENAYGKRDINCELGEDALDELNGYYREMTDAETGDRLFERTMWYCSAEDGWVVTGGSAAELYGIATEK